MDDREMQCTTVEPDHIFLMYAMSECREALDALQNVRRLAAIRDQSVPNIERAEFKSVIRALKQAMSAAANVSKIFWSYDTIDEKSSSKKKAAYLRSIRLRELCSLTDNHPAKIRLLRNHIEHTDERLDEWLKDGPRPFLIVEFVEHGFPPQAPDYINKAIAEACLMIYDATTHTVTFMGTPFVLEEAETALDEVMIAISRGMAKLREKWA